MLAHFMADPAYQEVILSGDIHTHNQNLAGLSERDYAKTFIYAFLYGSGIPNLARQLGLDLHTVEQAVAKFKRDLPKLTDLLERVQEAGRKFGYLLAVDGRFGRIRSKGGDLLLHTALNVLLQMTGSLVMKWGHVLAEDEAVARGCIDSVSNFPLLVHMHDEGQMEVNADEVTTMQYEIKADAWKDEEKRVYTDDEGKLWSAPFKVDRQANEGEGFIVIGRMYHPLGGIYAQSITKAGEFLKLRCQTDGEYKIGYSWADTH